MIHQHDKWWRLLADKGLLDRIDREEVDSGANESATVRSMRIQTRQGSGQASQSDLRYIPRVALSKFLSLLDEIDAGNRTSATMEALASFYVVGIATPIVSELAEFCRTYPYNKDPDKEKSLRYMLKHLRQFVTELQNSMHPYPYLNETKWQASMQNDFRSIACTEAKDKRKVPEGYPCIVRCRRSANGSFSVKTTYLLVNGNALAFTVPWIHSASKLPRSFTIKGMKDGYGLFGIVHVSEEELADIYRIGLTPAHDLYYENPEYVDLKDRQTACRKELSVFTTAKLERAREICAKPKSVKANVAASASKYVEAHTALTTEQRSIGKSLRQLEAELVSSLPHARLKFYPLDILICKVLDSEVTRPAVCPYKKVTDLLQPYCPDLPLTQTLSFINEPKGRKWKLTVE